LGSPEPPPYFACAGKAMLNNTRAQVHKSRRNLECKMKDSAGIGKLKPTLQSVGLKVFLNLHMLALLQKMALTVTTPEIIIILFIASKYKY
jgi:hypothetical protein